MESSSFFLLWQATKNIVKSKLLNLEPYSYLLIMVSIFFEFGVFNPFDHLVHFSVENSYAIFLVNDSAIH